MSTPDLPEQVVVGANGAYWRDYGDHYSMCPVSDDNDPVEPVAVYVRRDATPGEPEPDRIVKPFTPERSDGRDSCPVRLGDKPHDYSLTCKGCGQPGQIKVSVVP